MSATFRFLISLFLIIITSAGFAVDSDEKEQSEEVIESSVPKNKSLIEKLADSAEEEAPETSEKIEKSAEKVTEKVNEVLDKTKSRRSVVNYSVLGNYSYLDLLIPGKYGVSLSYIPSEKTTWELEYLKGSISVPFVVNDLGGMTDTRISLIKRSYSSSNSFNFSYGLSYFSFNVHLGNDLLDSLSAGVIRSSYDILEVSALGFNLALGNRWIIEKNITIGVDWLSWAQPVFVTSKKQDYIDHTTDSNDKDRAEDAMKIITYFPRLTLLKLQLGISF